LTGLEQGQREVAPGAPPGGSVVPLCVPELRGREWDYVKECLDTGWVSSVGSFVDRFEEELAREAGVRRAVATTSGTAALHVALLLAGVRAGDEVAVSSLSFVAPANAVRYLGAWPAFIGTDPHSWQLDPGLLQAFLRDECGPRDGRLVNRRTERPVGAILAVHALGHPVDLDAVAAIAEEFGLPLVEDAAESLGARYRGRPLGGTGLLGCLSFNGNKLITTGGGGMILTDDDALAARARYLTTQAKDDPVAYVHGEVGFNYRLGNVQAAMGCAQLELLDEYLSAKRRIARAYAEAVDGLPGVTFMPTADWAEPAHWLSTILVDPAAATTSRDDLLSALDRDGIQTRPLWQALHESPAHADAYAYRCEETSRLAARGLCLPSSVGLAPGDQQRVIAALRRELAR
jgi:perosamine synthetase